MAKTKKQLKKIAEQLYQLELECQKGNNISQNLIKMNSLVQDLEEEEVFELDNILQNKFHQ